MLKQILAIAMSIALLPGIRAEKSNSAEKINWVSIEQAQELVKKNPRKILVDVYTDWCGWCKRMEAVTFSHPVIVRYINENFYAVKLNAEQTEPITFRGQTFVNENPGQPRSAHNFAYAVLQGRLGYPAVAFFDEELNLITVLPGFRDPKQFEPILVFFDKNVYNTNPNLDEFIKNFESSIE